MPRRVSADKRVRLANIAIAKSRASEIRHASAIDAAIQTDLTPCVLKIGGRIHRRDVCRKRVRIERLDTIRGDASSRDEETGHGRERSSCVRDPLLMIIEL